MTQEQLLNKPFSLRSVVQLPLFSITSNVNVTNGANKKAFFRNFNLHFN